jgi:hypothetical protein
MAFRTYFFTVLAWLCVIITIGHGQPGGFDYKEVVEKSLLFFEAQRTGRLPSSNRIPWRGDSFLNDSGLNGEDLSGGYFDGKLNKKLLLPYRH